MDADMQSGAVPVSRRGQSGDKRLRISLCLAGAFCFAAAYRFAPLFHSNQNTKFLHGIARAHPERLGSDWMAHTVDGLPVFSGLVYLVERFGHPLLYPFVEAFLLAVLFVSLLVIGVNGTGTYRPAFSWNYLFVGAALIVSASVDEIRTAFEGVASQYLVGGYLQTSEFGVFAVAALALAATRRPSLALLAAAIPSVFHPGYILISTILVASVVFYEWREHKALPSLPVAAIVLLFLIAPPVDLAIRFAPTSAAVFERATYVLADMRIPQHSLPSQWFDLGVVAKLVLALAAMVATRAKVIRIALGGLLAYTIAGGLFVALTGNPDVALAAPWRASVIIVPVSAIILVGWIVDAIIDRLSSRSLRLLVFAPFAVLALLGIGNGIREKVKSPLVEVPPDYVEYARDNYKQGDLYLTDPQDQAFRLASMAPQFVSWKTHPYLDVEVLEWRRRLDLADAVFGRSADRKTAKGLDCDALTLLVQSYPVTHIVLNTKPDGGSETCPFLRPIMSGQQRRILEIDREKLDRGAETGNGRILSGRS